MIQIKNSKKIDVIINTFYLLIVLGVVYFAFKYVFKLFLPFIIALIISMLMESTVSTLIIKFGFKRTLSSIICVSIFYLVFSAAVILLSLITFDNITKLIETTPDFFDEIKFSYQRLYNYLSANRSDFFIESLLKLLDNISKTDIVNLLTGSIGSKIVTPISDLLKSIPSFFLTSLTTFVSSFLTSASMPTIKKFIIKLIPQNKRNFAIETKNTLIITIKNYAKSYVIIMFITFCELFILFLIFKIKPSFILAFVIAAVDILPIFGVGTILIPWALISILIGNYTKALVLISIYILITVVRQIIEPKIIGESIGLNPLITIVSIYLGFKLFGIIGLFLLPISATLLFNVYKTNFIKLYKQSKKY